MSMQEEAIEDAEATSTGRGAAKAPAVRSAMSRSVHTIGRDQTLAVAHKVMRQFNVRHLPVLEAGKLVGIVSARDLYFIESLRDVDPARTTVEEAMTASVFTCAPSTPLAEVTHTMYEHRYGAAIVMDGGRVVGVFTTTDALRVLSQQLGRGATPAR